jgi:NAD(P)-dependent dehydrogenase (short-subunit alcohol dehydrogenase family)
MPEPRVVLVTGGAYGIGRGIVLEFAKRGERIVIADRDDQRGSSVESSVRSSGGEAVFVHADIRVDDEVEELIRRAVESFGCINVLCNNAGIECYRRADAYALDEWNAIIETNLRGTYLCAKHAYGFLKKVQGCIINISSVQAFASEPHISAYAASKAGLLALTRAMAIDFAADGVRVNAVCPGAVQTGMMEVFLRGQDDPATVINEIGSKIPLGRVGQPE